MNSTELDSEDIMKTTKMKSNKEILNDTLIQKSGIYKIINKIDGKYYVGSTIKFTQRWTEHKNDLIHNRHPNDKLQRAWNKYGENAFVFVEIDYVLPNRKLLVETEQQYLDIAKTEQNRCYNLNFNASGGNTGWLGKKHTDESKCKMSLANKGRKCSPVTKAIKKIQNSGNSNPNSDPTIYKWKNVLTGNTFTGTRYEFRKTHNISVDSDKGLVKGEYSQTKSGWKLDTHQ